MPHMVNISTAIRFKPKGFTLIELLMTLLLLTILITVSLPLLEITVQRQREVELRSALREIREALNSYKKASDTGHIEKKTGYSGYPPNLEILVSGVKDIKDPKGRVVFFLRRVPNDPMRNDSETNPGAVWGLRSYASSAENPQNGDDVFDVFSLSSEIGLNGIPYRQW